MRKAAEEGSVVCHKKKEPLPENTLKINRKMQRMVVRTDSIALRRDGFAGKVIVLPPLC